MSIEVKGLLLGLAAALGLLGVAFGLSPLLRPSQPPDAQREPPTNTISIRAEAGLAGLPKQGYKLFDHNCAPCHGEDAHGDEGPDLHGLVKSDARLTALIKGGIKGEMPAFAKKFTDSDIQAVIAYLRTLKD
jgi:mono/diheme cytochrome c family protein